MANAARKTAAPKPAPKPAAFSLDNLTVADAELPKQSRTVQSGPNPFVAFLTASRDNSNAGKSVTVPAANVGQVQYLIRRAAGELNVGTRIVLRDSANETLDKDAMKALATKNPNASVMVLFATKDKRRANGSAAS